MNKNTVGPLAVILMGVAASGIMLAFSEQPAACLRQLFESNLWYPCLHDPCLKETLRVQFYRMNNSSNLALNISNAGASPKALIAQYVKNSNGSQYANGSWPEPTIPRGVAISVNMLIDG